MKKIDKIVFGDLQGEKLTRKNLKYIIGGTGYGDGYGWYNCGNGNGYNFSYCCKGDPDEFCVYGK